MKAIKFPGHNVIFVDHKGTETPAYRTKDRKGIVVIRYKFSFWERIYILLWGKLWFAQQTSNANLKPWLLTINHKDISESVDPEQKKTSQDPKKGKVIPMHEKKKKVPDNQNLQK